MCVIFLTCRVIDQLIDTCGTFANEFQITLVLEFIYKMPTVRCLTQVAHVIYKPTLGDTLMRTQKYSLPIY